MSLLKRIETIGNRLPDPATLFFIGLCVVMLLSWIANTWNWSVSSDIKGELTANSLISADGAWWLLSHLVENFITFPPLGIVLVVWGMVYLRFIAPLLLPDRASMSDLLSDKSRMKFFTEAVVPLESDLIGRTVTGVQLFKRDGVRLVDVLRGDVSLRRNLHDVSLMAGDRVVLCSQVSELLSLQRDKSLRRVDQV